MQCLAWGKVWQQDLAMLQGRAGSGLLPFSKGEKVKTDPQISKLGFADVTFGWQGLVELPRGTVRSQGSMGHQCFTTTQKGPTTGCGVPWRGGSASCAIPHPKKGL